MVIWLSINFFSAPIRGYFLLSNYFLLNLPYLSIIFLRSYLSISPIHVLLSIISHPHFFLPAINHITIPINFLPKSGEIIPMLLSQLIKYILHPACYKEVPLSIALFFTSQKRRKFPLPPLSSLQVRSGGLL